MSGMGKARKNWNRIQNLLSKHEFNYSFAFSEYSKHETVLVQNAIKNGYRKFISIGGDGTLFHVLNGVMNQEIVSSLEISIGVIPIGTGNDWSRSYFIPRNIEKAILVIKNKKTIVQDVGLVTLENNNANAYFNTLAGSGFVGHVVHKTNAIKKIGALAFAVGTLLSLAGHKLNAIKASVNNQEIYAKSLLIVVGNLKYAGGGMQLTQNPNGSDGLLDVTIAKNISKIGVIINVLKLFNGKIVNHKNVENFKTTLLKVEITDNSNSYVIADGEMLGEGNYTIQIIPKAVTYFIA